MSKHDEILTSEKVIRALIAELEQLKSARQVLEDAAERSQQLRYSSQTLVNEIGKLAGSAEEILERLKALNLDAQLANASRQLETKLRGFKDDIAKASERELNETHRLSADMGRNFSHQSAALAEMTAALEKQLAAMDAQTRRESRVTRTWLLVATGLMLAIGSLALWLTKLPPASP
jgi:chromosome segregation ATPase